MMNESFKDRIKKLYEKNSQWGQIVERYYLGNEITEAEEIILDEYMAAIIAICEAVKKEEYSIEMALELFSDNLQPHIEEELKNRLRPYYGCALIRKNENNSRTQIELLIDEIWQQRVIRRNPDYKFNVERKKLLAASNKDIEKFVVTLCAIVDHCVSRLLSYDAMVSVICDQTGISKDFGEYIARRIEKDSEVLRTNFIIKRLVSLSVVR